MIISDLNYLELTSEEIFGGRGTTTTDIVRVNTAVVQSDVETITKTINVTVNVPGNFAEAVATADARGNNSISSTVTNAQVEPGISGSFSSSTAARV